jgi:hypothetical protein
MSDDTPAVSIRFSYVESIHRILPEHKLYKAASLALICLVVLDNCNILYGSVFFSNIPQFLRMVNN